MKIFLKLFSISIAGCLFILLFKIKTDNLDSRKKNGFIRKIIPGLLKQERTASLPFNSYYIAGMTTDKIYLANSMRTSSLVIIDNTLSRFDFRELSIPQGARIAWRAANVYIDAPSIYLYEGVSPLVFTGNLSNLDLKDSFNFKHSGFNSLLPVSKSSFILNKFDNLSNVRKLIKNTDTFSLPANKKSEAFFSTDGCMIYSKAMNRLIYLYFYRNQYLCLDTSLTLIRAANTIDTNSFAKIVTDTIHTENKITFAAPPLLVNHCCCSEDKYLFIHSVLRADNEMPGVLKKQDVFDIYDLSTMTYLSSFYIPTFRNNKISFFKIKGNSLVAIYENYIVTYKIARIF
jgi:hypothetical protein